MTSVTKDAASALLKQLCGEEIVYRHDGNTNCAEYDAIKQAINALEHLLLVEFAYRNKRK